MKKLLSILLIIFTGSISANAQTADPYISINASPATVLLNANSTLGVVTGNFGNDNIVSNSIQITISTSSNSSIQGLGAGSDTRWTVFNLSVGNGNTIVLRNTGAAPFGPFDIGLVNITIKGTIVNPLPATITSNISYILGANPLLGGAQSATQGNLVIGNDNSLASLTVSGTPNFTATIDISGLVFTPNPPVNSGSTRDFIVNIIELNNSPSTGQVIFRVTKPSAYTITVNPTATTAQYLGTVSVQNNDWIIDNSNPLFAICTLKNTASVPANGASKVAFTITRNPATGIGTQNLGAVIQNGTGGDVNNADNNVNVIVSQN